MGRYYRKPTKAQRIAKLLKSIKAKADKALLAEGIDPVKFFKGVKAEYSAEFILLCHLACCPDDTYDRLAVLKKKLD